MRTVRRLARGMIVALATMLVLSNLAYAGVTDRRDVVVATLVELVLVGGILALVRSSRARHRTL